MKCYAFQRCDFSSLDFWIKNARSLRLLLHDLEQFGAHCGSRTHLLGFAVPWLADCLSVLGGECVFRPRGSFYWALGFQPSAFANSANSPLLGGGAAARTQKTFWRVRRFSKPFAYQLAYSTWRAMLESNQLLRFRRPGPDSLDQWRWRRESDLNGWRFLGRVAFRVRWVKPDSPISPYRYDTLVGTVRLELTLNSFWDYFLCQLGHVPSLGNAVGVEPTWPDPQSGELTDVLSRPGGGSWNRTTNSGLWFRGYDLLTNPPIGGPDRNCTYTGFLPLDP